MTLRINGGKIMNKKSPIRTVLFVISAILFFAAVGSIIGGWQGLIKTRNENFIALIVAGIVFEIISVILFKKIKYYCEVYQTRIIRTRFKAANFRSYCVKCLARVTGALKCFALCNSVRVINTA